MEKLDWGEYKFMLLFMLEILDSQRWYTNITLYATREQDGNKGDLGFDNKCNHAVDCITSSKSSMRK